MRTIVGLLVGAGVAGTLWVALREVFAAPLFARRNHRGVDVPVGAGLVLVLAVVAVSALERGLFGLGVQQRTILVGDLIPFGVVAFGLLGLFDDLAGSADHRGFSGHLRALARGRITTGGLKVLGGGAVAMIVAGAVDPDLPLRFVVDTLLIALSANLGNLLDRAPGRAIKGTALAGGVLVLTHLPYPPFGLPVVLGAALGLLWFDLREELMLGDAGANALGAAVGIAVVVGCAPNVRLAVLLAVLALNVASERVSFSAVIERWPPLRFLDRLGRPRA